MPQSSSSFFILRLKAGWERWSVSEASDRVPAFAKAKN